MQSSLDKQYATQILRPEVFLLFAHDPKDLASQYQHLISHYKFAPLVFNDILREEQAITDQNGAMEDRVTKQIAARVLKKALALNGCKRYLIADFPLNKHTFEEFEKLIGDEAVIKKVIVLKNASVSQNPENKVEEGNTQKNQDSLQELLEVVQLDKVISADNSHSPQQLSKYLRSQLHSHSIHPLPPVEVFFVSGGPGAGKGTQCSNLVKDYGFKHLSTGDLLRDAIKNGSKEGLAIDSCIKNGQLVSSDLLVDLIRCEIAKNNHSGKYLIDGFPRNLENDRVWSEMMENDAIVKGLLYMKCGEEIMQKRVIERSKTSERSDDNLETMKKRFKVYYKETEPIIQRYQQNNNVIEIDSEKPTEEVYEQIQKELEKKGVYPKGKVLAEQPGVILVLGGPGSGKGTQCENLVNHFGFKHLSTGDLLRDEQKQRGLNSELIEDHIKEGKLVPSKILVRLIKKAMHNKGWNGIYLLDGFPRNLQNIEAWEQQIGDLVNIQHCLLFDCCEKVMEERLLTRGKTSGRSDDNPETIRKRFHTFQKETSPIIARYQIDHANIKVNAEQEIHEVFEDLKQSLINKGFKVL